MPPTAGGSVVVPTAGASPRDASLDDVRDDIRAVVRAWYANFIDACLYLDRGPPPAHPVSIPL